MNAERRKTLVKAQDLIEQGVALLEEARDEEQEAFDNMPEGLRSSERGEKSQACIDAIQEVIDGIENADWSTAKGES